MRQDMDKVLVERPRYPGRPRKGRPERDPELLRGFVGLQRQVKERGDWKMLSENFAPLRRFLEGQVGRPSNKVYAEMRARINPANEVQAHVLAHVDLFVERLVSRVGAGAAAPCGLTAQRSMGGMRALEPGDLYVDPDDGIIKRARRRIKAPSAPRAPHSDRGRRRLGRDRIALAIDGCWHAVEHSSYRVVETGAADGGAAPRLAFNVAGRTVDEWVDPLLGPVWPHDKEKLLQIARLYGFERIGLRKLQLGKRELRRWRLPANPPAR